MNSIFRFLATTVLLLGVCPFVTLHAQRVPDWEELKGCTLVGSAWLDGDSFTVETPRGEMIIRLYFVDAPEDSADTRFPERIADQAEYFGVSPQRVVRVGDQAAAFTRRTLTNEPFSVFVCGQRAPGRSAKQRIYGLVQTNVGDLGELLVRNGLARIYGKRITLPDGTSSADYRAKLHRMEQEARSNRLGGWAME